MRLAYLVIFLFSLMFNALSLETVIFKYAGDEYVAERLGNDCTCPDYSTQQFDFPYN